MRCISRHDWLIVCLIGGMAAGLIHPVAAQSYVYYLQPPTVGPRYYMDVLQPNGPADGSTRGIFYTRVLGATVTLSWYGATLYVRPETYDTFYDVSVGLVNEQFNYAIAGEWAKNRVLVPVGAEVVSFRFDMPALIADAGDRLFFQFTCAHDDDRCLHPSPMALWGDAAHLSRFECSLDPSNLSGQPVPEFPAPIVAVVTLLAGVLVINIDRRRSAKSGHFHPPVGEHITFNQASVGDNS